MNIKLRRLQMETFSVLLVRYEGTLPASGGDSPHKGQ